MWKEVKSDTTVHGFDITIYQNQSHGLKLAHIDVPGPTISGYFTLATEAHDHDGNPHVLEHLVFLGSKRFPYKGVLDCVANRSFAQGTNAWTDTDHTCYTISTAGQEGFLQVLPVFLDHILFPTITDSGFHTEVHHINGQGEDAGVVYSEMQGRENSCQDLLHFSMLNSLYPPESGYTSETGGKLENLRSLTVAKVREYHGSFYRPNNLCVIIVGHLSDPSSLFKSLEPIDRAIGLEYSNLDFMKLPRPWSANPKSFAPLPATSKKIVLFPEEDETMGSMILAWRGPEINEHKKRVALELLFAYLSESPISPLQKSFVEIEDPFCTDIDFSFLDFSSSSFFCELANVPCEKESEIQSLFLETLRSHSFDLERMKVVIERQILSESEEAETNPHHSMSVRLISDFLYGATTGSDCLLFFEFQKHANEIKNGWNVSDWKSLMETWLLAPNHILLFGKPSKEYAKNMAEIEKSRVKQQVMDLGPSNLSKLDKELENAKSINELPIPGSLLETFRIPSVDSINFHNVGIQGHSIFLSSNLQSDSRFRVEDSNANLSFNSIFFNEITSAFIEINLYLSTEHLKPEDRLYLPCYLEAFFQTPICDPETGKNLSHEEVVEGLQRDTVSIDNCMGLNGGSSFSCGDFANFIVVSIKVSKEKYAKGISWLRNLIWHSCFDEERLKVACSKLSNEIPEMKREAMVVAKTSLRHAVFNEKQSNHLATSFITQQGFLKSMLKSLNGKASKQGAVNSFNSFSQSLWSPEKIIVQVIGTFKEISNPLSLWNTFRPKDTFANHKAFLSAYKIPMSSDERTVCGKNPSGAAIVHELKSVESTCAVFCAVGPTEFQDKNIPAILVLHELLSTMEGPFWKEIRGKGLAYSCHLTFSIEHGLLYFYISRSPDVFDAFIAASNIIKKIQSGESEAINQTFLESTKSSVIYDIISREETQSQAAFQIFANCVFRKRDERKLIKLIEMVTIQDLVHVLEQYTCNLFDPSKSMGSIVTSSNKKKDIMEKFERFGFKVRLEKLK